MIEKSYKFSISDDKAIEKLVNDDNVAINHMVLPQGMGLPKHFSNSNVYMIIVRGIMTIKLDTQDAKKFSAGHILNIPYNTHMDAKNVDDGILEFFVVKSPNPKYYEDK